MSATSGGAGQVIALPQGGGAIKGIGETFAADVHTGTGSITVPIDLPPGRNGVQPNLALHYGTGSGNGPFGLGWSLSVPSVSRDTSRGLPTYDDAEDHFVLSGSERLVPVGGNRYRPRTEGLFARIERRADGWRVHSQSGVVSDHTTTVNAGAKVFAWLLTRTYDAFGNEVTYTYERDGAQQYLSEISWLDGLAAVRFRYEDRGDVIDDRRPTFEVTTRRRCHRIEIHSGDQLTRTIALGYQSEGRSLLTTLTVTGHDGERTEQLPPLTFRYSGFAPEQRRFAPVHVPDLAPDALADPAVDLVDLTGDGRPDLVELGDGAIRYWRNLGGGRFDRPRRMADAPTVRGRLLDADGDGRLELVTDDGWFPLTAGGEWDHRSFRPYRQAPSVGLDDPRLRLVDLDGDGVTDALRTGARVECYFSDPVEGWQRAETTGPAAFDLADPRIRLADMSGDGLTDVVLVHSGRVEVRPSFGFGRFGEPRVMRDSPRFPAGYDPRRVLLADVDGDGATDLVYVADGTVTVWLNESGQRWGAPIEVRGTPSVSDLDAIRVCDLYGTGVSGVLWSGPARMSFLDLTGGVKPGLLTGMENGLGARTEVTYGPSTVYDNDYLPFPVGVVAGVRTVDEISGSELTCRYEYAHGYWDGGEREFRGFGRVDQYDTATVGGEHASPPLLTRSWFHQGTDVDRGPEYWAGDRNVLPASEGHRALRGRVLRAELYEAGVEIPVTVSESAYGVRTEAPGVWFPFPRAERVTQWDGGDDPMTRLTTTESHDAYGHPTTSAQVAVPRGRRYGPGEPCLATRTETTYANRDDADRYQVGMPATVTSYELPDDGGGDVLDLPDALAGPVIGATVHHYDGEPFEGLPAGRLGAHGLLTRTETLVLTPEIAAAAYGTLPPYLADSPQWTDEYPAGFRDVRTGYVRRPDGWYAVTAARRHDPANGLLLASRDAVGGETVVEYDERGLLPVTVTDPAGLTIRAVNDYRVWQPTAVTDPNGNVSTARFSPLGRLTAVALLGRPDQPGDTEEVPGVRITDDLLAWTERRQPASTRTVTRVHHVTDQQADPAERDATIESVTYSDGFGRTVQTRARADGVAFGDPLTGELAADPQGRRETGRVTVSGWQVYDHKGRVVETYEPFFATGFDYATPAFGRKVVQRYDARGRLVRTIHPDGSEQRVVHGVPDKLDDPDQFRPTPWETYTYDQNDNAGRTHPDAALPYREHWDTPASTLVDALGRTVSAVGRDGTDRYAVTSTHDVRGNLLTLTDELGRPAVRQRYDLANRVLAHGSPDGGTDRTVYDAAGAVLEERDARGALTLHGYDAAHRPDRVWAADRAGAPVTLREVLVYGTDPAGNLAGRVVRHHDGAGVATVLACDLRGDVLAAERQLLADDVETPDWPAAPLAPGSHRTDTRYDALGRVRLVRLPTTVDGHRPELRPRYNEAGGLSGADLDGAVFVERIGYDAQGRRSLVVYGNGLLTRHAYDPRSMRLARTVTTRFTRTGPFGYQPAGQPVQDLGYAYDLVGNLLGLDDAGFGRQFTYDPLYRLRTATGREHDLPPADPPWLDRAGGTDLTRTRPYTERYEYDPAGNLTTLRHESAAAASNRVLSTVDGGNRLATLRIGQTSVDYTHDEAGNIVTEAGVRHFVWDHAGRLVEFRTQTGDAEPSIRARYRYDAAGVRVQKIVTRQGGVTESTVYLGGVFEHHRAPGRESNTLHVLDGARRVATVRIGPADPADRTPAVQYLLGDHLGSTSVVLDGAGGPVSREEYTPYGETSFGAVGFQRYRFTGKERDSESGLYFHGARYYAPWLARWTALDPAGTVDGTNRYAYTKGNPLRWTDPTGTQSAPPVPRTIPPSARLGPGPARYTEYGLPIVDSTNGPAAGVPEAPDPYYADRLTIPEMREGVKKMAEAPLSTLNLLPVLGRDGTKEERTKAIDAGAAMNGLLAGAGAIRPAPKHPTGSSGQGQTSGQVKPVAPRRTPGEGTATSDGGTTYQGVTIAGQKTTELKAPGSPEAMRFGVSLRQQIEIGFQKYAGGSTKLFRGDLKQVSMPATPNVVYDEHTHVAPGGAAFFSATDAKTFFEGSFPLHAELAVHAPKYPAANTVLRELGMELDSRIMRTVVTKADVMRPGAIVDHFFVLHH